MSQEIDTPSPTTCRGAFRGSSHLAALAQAHERVRELPITQRLVLQVHATLLFVERRRLTLPLLYLSHFFETHRQEYYDRLQAVREEGDMEGWILFFLRAVRAQADDAVERARRLIEIRERYYDEAIRERSSLPQLVEMIVRNPLVTVRRVQMETGLTNQGARNLIRRAERKGWLTSMGVRKQGGRAYWYAHDVLSIMETPMTYVVPGVDDAASGA